MIIAGTFIALAASALFLALTATIYLTGSALVRKVTS